MSSTDLTVKVPSDLHAKSG